jgi:hypothetical protein
MTAPGVPTLLTATAGDRSIALQWAAPTSTGGAAIESYLVEVLSAEGVRSESVFTTSATVSALTPGVTYRVRVAAVNSVEPGPWTDWSADVTPQGPASAPRDVIAVASARSIDLSWDAPASDGGSPVMGYDVEIASSGQTQVLSVDQESTTLLGLAPGATYSLRVAAMTEVGRGDWSAPVSVTISAPRVSAPRSVKATWTARTVTVRWKAPTVGTAVRYIVRASINGRGYITVSSTERTATAFLVPSRARTVMVRVQAVDQQGPGSVSAPTRPRTRS